MEPRLCLFPHTACINERGHLAIGGLDAASLAGEFGTPLYVFDEQDIRDRCAEYRREFGERWADTRVIFACKAFINGALARIFHEEGLGLDVVSAGEMAIARSVDFPMDSVYLHGNNKFSGELAEAMEVGVGRIVVDGSDELQMLSRMAEERRKRVNVLLRINPAVDPHTHSHIATGVVDSKFGFPLEEGEGAVAAAMAAPGLNLIGLHIHIGSSIFEVEPYVKSLGVALDFAAAMRDKQNFVLKELDIGGGFAMQYTMDTPAPPISTYAEALTGALRDGCRRLGLEAPRLVIEPGRSVVGPAGVALYTVGVIKDVPGIRRYVSVDGGMGDNIRPALYGARYEAVAADKMRSGVGDKVTIAGKFCESGDILIKDIAMPELTRGDIIAIPGCGAYCIPQSSNFNASLKPAIVLVGGGKARLIRRRETFEDLTRCDLD